MSRSSEGTGEGRGEEGTRRPDSLAALASILAGLERAAHSDRNVSGRADGAVLPRCSTARRRRSPLAALLRRMQTRRSSPSLRDSWLPPRIPSRTGGWTLAIGCLAGRRRVSTRNRGEESGGKAARRRSAAAPARRLRPVSGCFLSRQEFTAVVCILPPLQEAFEKCEAWNTEVGWAAARGRVAHH